MSDNRKYREFKCECCGEIARKPARHTNAKYCSLKCHYELQRKKKTYWAECSACMASIGLGSTVAARVLGACRTKVYSEWKRRGIEQVKPMCGSWSHYVPASVVSSRAYEKARMDDIKQACKKGFDWGCIWSKERALRSANSHYHRMTPDEKKARNRKVMMLRSARMKSDPEAKAKYAVFQKTWKNKNKDKVKEYNKRSIKKRKANDPGFRVQCNMRNRFKDIMKTTRKGGSSYSNGMLGCTTRELAKHLESMFSRYMTWDNYGTYWHVDHILPCASFDHADDSQVKQCWHWTNMQPLEAKENMDKSDTIEDPQMSLLMEFTH